jgi:hypothetical protein
MPWTLAPNCHAQIWKNNANVVSPPAGAPTYNGPAQLLTPALKSPSANPWRGRIVLPPNAVKLLGSDINAVGTFCWLAIVDDLGGGTGTWGYWRIVDISLSTRPLAPGPNMWQVDAVFLDFVLAL